MNKHEITQIKERLSVLHNQKLCRVIRGGSMGTFCFGPMIKAECLAQREQRDCERRPALVPKYALHAYGNFRISCGNQVILAKGDIYEPKDDLRRAPDFDMNKFDYDVVGNNRFEDLAKKYFSDEGTDFFVEKISVNKLGDLNILLTHGFELEIFIDVSGNEECWRFFEDVGEKGRQLVVLGTGVEHDDDTW